MVTWLAYFGNIDNTTYNLSIGVATPHEKEDILHSCLLKVIPAPISTPARFM